ncbi:MAG: hypothetical protein IT393_10715 [Nitrospirae bacterium]|nr:hypothetical protein [Nitrospirota bacterium]
MRTETDAVTLSQAARVLNRDTSTLRRWIKKGCPTVRMGETGREGSLVCLDDIKRWRAGVDGIGSTELLETFATALLDSLKRDEVHLRAEITERQTAIALLLAFNRLFKNMYHREIDKDDPLPEAIRQIRTFAVE